MVWDLLSCVEGTEARHCCPLVVLDQPELVLLLGLRGSLWWLLFNQRSLGSLVLEVVETSLTPSGSMARKFSFINTPKLFFENYYG
jgi:hypothetical protein